MQTSRSIRQSLQLSNNAKIQELLSPFEDSTHQIFIIEERNDKQVVKIPNPAKRQASDFWQWMSTCFGITVETQVARFPQLYPLIDRLSPLQIPALKGQQSLQDGTLLTQTEFLPGRPLTPSDLTDSVLQSLARHMAALHQQTSNVFGDLAQHKHHNAQRWMERLTEGLVACALGIPSEISDAFKHSRFGLIMPDFRWDQFLLHEGKLALTDLDAIVYGPIELDWILLEYLLTPDQARLFVEEYLKYSAQTGVPKIGKVREGYRTLLYLMNVLGEKDYQAWCRQPTLFD